MKIIFATTNKGKLKEVRELFCGTNISFLSLEEIRFGEEIGENGLTFEENAFIKADKIFSMTGLPVIADDSGLVVNQLNGKPGIYSARFAGENATYLDNNLKLISELKNFKAPHLAKFVCCAVYIDGNNRIAVTGEMSGQIINEFKGENGFGYDPIFIPEGFDLTLAEMGLQEKNKISHRAKAFSILKKDISRIIL